MESVYDKVFDHICSLLDHIVPSFKEIQELETLITSGSRIVSYKVKVVPKDFDLKHVESFVRSFRENGFGKHVILKSFVFGDRAFYFDACHDQKFFIENVDIKIENKMAANLTNQAPNVGSIVSSLDWHDNLNMLTVCFEDGAQLLGHMSSITSMSGRIASIVAGFVPQEGSVVTYVDEKEAVFDNGSSVNCGCGG